MMETLGGRQQDLLRALLENKSGLTVDELSKALGITRNAIRQHLSGMERDGLVGQAGTRPTGGRPEQLYVLGEKGRELFPRHYSWFAQLLIESIREEAGSAGLGKRMSDMGTRVADQLGRDAVMPESLAQRLARLAELMTDLGYGAKTAAPADGFQTIEASNCVFHHLAEQYPEVCQFDLALMSRLAGKPVEHQECMVRGGQICRFGFKDRT